jgi:membrane protease YdiL (CAAX protease family)
MQKPEESPPKSLSRRLALYALYLACGLGVFVLSYFSPALSIVNVGMPVAFLITALGLRNRRLEMYSQVFFALFIFSSVWFTRHLILDSAFVQPFYKTLGGNVIAQLIDSTVVIVPVILLTIASRAKLSSIFLRKGNLRLGFVVGSIVIMIIYVLSAIIAVLLGGMSFGHFIFLTPYLLVLALANGFKEELLFRGLFLNKYEPILGFQLANSLQALIFAASVVEAEFSSILVGITLVSFFLGLGLGYLMRKSGSIIGSSLCEAGSTIPIFLGVISALK